MHITAYSQGGDYPYQRISAALGHRKRALNTYLG